MTKKEVALVSEMMKTPKKDWKKLVPCAPWHGSAYSLEKDGYSICISYTTDIAMLTPKGEVMRLWDGYSKTSMVHLSAWCTNHRVPFINGKIWNNMIVGKKYKKTDIEKFYEENENEVA